MYLSLSGSVRSFSEIGLEYESEDFGWQLESLVFLFPLKAVLSDSRRIFFLRGGGGRAKGKKKQRKYGPGAERLLFIPSRIAQLLCPFQTSWRGVFLPPLCFPPSLGSQAEVPDFCGRMALVVTAGGGPGGREFEVV